jgi:hypothetical protein
MTIAWQPTPPPTGEPLPQPRGQDRAQPLGGELAVDWYHRPFCLFLLADHARPLGQ